MSKTSHTLICYLLYVGDTYNEIVLWYEFPHDRANNFAFQLE